MIKYLLIIIIILNILGITSFILNKTNKDRYYDSKKKLYTGLTQYRIGDLFYMREARGIKYCGKISCKEYHLINFPNTIASEYMRRTDDEGNYEILHNIVLNTKLKDPSLYVPKNSCMIHLRIGDVIDESEFTVSQLLEKARLYGNLNYVKPHSYYLEKIEKLKDLGVKDVLIIAGSHNDYDLTKSWEYITEIEKLFLNNGFNVMLYTGNHPDDDLILSFRVKYFIASGGGYSDLLSNINRLNGGTTL